MTLILAVVLLVLWPAVASAQYVTGAPISTLANPVTPAQGGLGGDFSASTGVLYDAAGTFSAIACASGLLQGGTPPTCTTTPALGTPASGVATNLTGTAAGLTAGNASLLNGTTWTAPGPIGGTTPSTGAFTTLAYSGQATSSFVNGASTVLRELHDPTISGTVGSAAGNVGGYKFGQTYVPTRFTNGPGGEPNYIDDSWHFGPNVGTGSGGVGRIDTGKMSFGLSFEARFYSDTFGGEFHLQGVTTDGVTSFRPLTFFMAHDASKIEGAVKVDTFTVYDKAGNSLVQISDAVNAMDLNGVTLRGAITNVPLIQQKNAAGSGFVNLLSLAGGNVAQIEAPLYVTAARAGTGSPSPGSFMFVQPSTANSGDKILDLSGPAVSGTLYGLKAVAPVTGGFELYVENSAAGTGSHATLALSTSDGAGDPFIRFAIAGGATWSMGVDNSASDTFKLSQGSTVGNTDRLTVTTGGAVALTPAADTTPFTITSWNPTGTNASPMISGSGTINQGTNAVHALDFSFIDTSHATGSTLFRIRGGAGGTTGMLSVDTSGNLMVPQIKSTTGQRYVCIDTAGTFVSSAAACVGT